MYSPSHDTFAKYIFDVEDRDHAKEYLPTIFSAVKCRFCHSVPAHSRSHFKKESHVFPESLGNNWLFSREECDECNERASKLEADLAELITPFRFVSRIRGKKSTFTHKLARSGDLKSHLRNDYSATKEINIHAHDSLVRMRATQDGFWLTIKIRGYSYENIARALARLGFFVLSSSDYNVIGPKLQPWVAGRQNLVSPMPLWYALVPKMDGGISGFSVELTTVNGVTVLNVLFWYIGFMLFLSIPFGQLTVGDLAPPSELSGVEDPIDWKIVLTNESPKRFIECPFTSKYMHKVRPPTEDDIRRAAYFRWLDKGCPVGTQHDDWLEAETELAFTAWIAAGFGADED